MGRPTHVYIVCSPRPQVGRTLIARALIDFYRVDGRSVKAFDVDAEEQTLARFLPSFASRADISQVQGQMVLFDQLVVDDELPKVVDLGAQSFATFFQVMEQTQFVAEAKRASVIPIPLFVVNPDRRAVVAYGEIANRFPELPLVPVFNEPVARGPGLRQMFPRLHESALPLHVPTLSSALRTVVDAASFSFLGFKRYPLDVPPTLEDELNSWMRRVFIQFRELELRLLLDRLRGSLSGLPSPS